MSEEAQELRTMKARSPNARTANAQGSSRTMKLSGGDRRTMQIYMTAALFDRVRDEALKDGRTIAGQVRHMAECYFDGVPREATEAQA